jgi:hypothetical protein
VLRIVEKKPTGCGYERVIMHQGNAALLLISNAQSKMAMNDFDKN